MFDQSPLEIEFFLFAPDSPLDSQLDRAEVLVATDQDELVTSKQVIGVFGVNAVGDRSLDRQPVDVVVNGNVGHCRSPNALVKATHLLLDVLVGTHVLALAETLASQLVQQPAVDVIPDTEIEDPGTHGIVFRCVGHDCVGIGLACRGKSIGEEDHVTGILVILEHLQGYRQCPVNVGAAAGIDSVHETEGLLARAIAITLHLGLETLDLCIVGHDVKKVTLVQVIEYEADGPLGLLDLLATHATGAVDHEDHVLANRRLHRRLDFRADQQHEVTILVLQRSVGDQAGSHGLVANIVHQAKVTPRDDVVLDRLHGCLPGARPLDLQRVAGAIDVLDRRVVLEEDPDNQLLDRLGSILGGTQRKQ